MVPQLFLDLAEELAAADAGPARFRSAIGRAYYAVYNEAERFLQAMNFHRPKKDYHVVLQTRLKRSNDPEISQIGSDLGDFHFERIQADYQRENHAPERKNNALAAVMKAKLMFESLVKCPRNSDRWKGIQAAIASANVTGTDNLAVSGNN